MWERFSYYGMRALLVLYMIKGFLAMNDGAAYAVYGAYTALVYATPFIGGMLADRLLGARRAVVLGGLLMAAGHLMMTIEVSWAFYLALALLIAGNGFFKPNISTMVGQLYPPGSAEARRRLHDLLHGDQPRRRACRRCVCGYVGETYGWHYGFGLATIGMLTGVAVFVAPIRLTQLLILGGALATGDLAAVPPEQSLQPRDQRVRRRWRWSSRASWPSSRSGAAGCRRRGAAAGVGARASRSWPVYLGVAGRAAGVHAARAAQQLRRSLGDGICSALRRRRIRSG